MVCKILDNKDPVYRISSFPLRETENNGTHIYIYICEDLEKREVGIHIHAMLHS